ncbi:MAG: 50S ribosomal protein L6 [Bdellovibrionota bacterium]
MSRIGKQPISLGSSVKAKIDGNIVSITGPKGTLSYECASGVEVKQDGDYLIVSSLGEEYKALYGTTRSNLHNMVQGVVTPWKKELELQGVGYTVRMDGNTICLSVGFSHEVKIPVPAMITCTASKTDITLESIDKQLLGNFASKVRKVAPPEPYLGKGIRYKGEYVRRKAGKTGKK